MTTKLKIEDKWEVCYDGVILTEYDNYVSGFEPFKDGDLLIDNTRVFISVDKVTSEADILVHPWKDGETYPHNENRVPKEVNESIQSIVKESSFFKNIQAQNKELPKVNINF